MSLQLQQMTQIDAQIQFIDLNVIQSSNPTGQKDEMGRAVEWTCLRDALQDKAVAGIEWGRLETRERK